MRKMLLLSVIVFSFFLIATFQVSAQIQITPEKCPDYCDARLSMLFQKGTPDPKTGKCVYALETPCKYGCDTKSIEPVCAEFPNTPPINATEFDETLWGMTKKLYDSSKNRFSIDVHGTEYQIGDTYAKVFLQLLDENSDVIINSTCFSTSYKPDSTLLFENQIMSYAGNGLYYYNYNFPSVTGVYMLSAYCVIPAIDYNLSFGYDDFECDALDCGSGWSSNWTSSPSNEIVVNGVGNYEGDYHLRIGVGGDASLTAYRNITIPTNDREINTLTISFASNKVNINGDDVMQFYVCDTSDCHLIVDTDTWTSTWSLNSYTINSTVFNLTNESVITLKFNASNLDGTGDYLKVDYFNMSTLYMYNDTYYQTVRGSGEVHISNIFNESILTDVFSTINQTSQYILGLSNLTAQDVWSYINRTLTDYNQTDVFDYLYYINTTSWDNNYWIKQNNDILLNLTIGNVSVYADINWTRLRQEVWNSTSQEKLQNDMLAYAADEIQFVVSNDTCVDSTTLMHQLNITRCIVGNCWTENTENPENCVYGCYEGKCRPDPTLMYGMLIGLIIAVGTGMYFINRYVRF